MFLLSASCNFVERQGFPGELADALPNIAFLLLSLPLLLPFFFPSSQDEKHTRKSVIAQPVIFTDSTAASMKRSDASPPAEFSKSAKQARLFSHTAAG